MASDDKPSSGTEPGAETAVADQPLLRVVKGNPTPEEFAALVAVVSARLRGAESAQPQQGRPRSQPGWAAYWRRTRTPLRPSPGAWRASALPR
ncbi:acyl-CoA carboxylase subunit epsilon [Actinopolymorpha alba]|uniref:acyl-CoA carboxylase subunit epsilon n=1 Tax=Actinopolymorpha alba TaxID=533267 RepID=UPI0003603133|nr:acyl-CoA carboxylase subunit epsilon [Actinopolymorpha alba]